MIRINLLPHTKRAARVSAPSGGGQLWAVIYLIGVLVLAAILAVIYFNLDGTLQEQLAANQALSAQIEELRSRSARLEEVQASLEASRTLEQVVDELNRARTGPIRAMMELSKILSVCPVEEPNCTDIGPTIDPVKLESLRQDNPYATFSRGWDVRRLWLLSFEEENRQCRIRGIGRSNEDVAEFLRRLALSELFDQVTLQRTAAETDDQTGLELISFEMTSQVTY